MTTHARSKRPFAGAVGRMIKVLLVLGLALPGLAVTAPSVAQAACTDTPFVGHWEAIRPEMNAIAEVQIEAYCPPGEFARYRVRVLTRCLPRNCSWGWAYAQKRGENRLDIAFSTFSAYRYVSVAYQHPGLAIAVRHDYHSPAREDVEERAILAPAD